MATPKNRSQTYEVIRQQTRKRLGSLRVEKGISQTRKLNDAETTHGNPRCLFMTAAEPRLLAVCTTVNTLLLRPPTKAPLPRSALHEPSIRKECIFSLWINH